MADNETIADIIAEMRRRSDEAYKGSFNYPECQENQIEYDEASDWADRLEAAHKRERGNFAALREALVKCREIALQWLADEAAGVAGTTDKPHARSAAEAVVDMEFEINAALAATENEGGAK